MRETWYVLEDDTAVHPNDCSIDAGGVLMHKSGARVAMRFADCPMSRSVEISDGPSIRTDMQPDQPPAAKPRKGYKTRGSKAG